MKTNLKSYELQWESPHLGYYWCNSFVYLPYKSKHLQRIMGFQENEYIVINENGNFMFLLNEDEIKRNRNRSLAFFLNEGMYQKWVSEINTIDVIVKSLLWEYNLKCISTKELVSRMFELENVFINAVALHFVSQPHHIKVLQDELGDDCYKATSRLTLPTKLPNVLQEQKEWYLLCKKYFTSSCCSNTTDIINAHLAKWKYITAGDSKSPMDEEFLLQRLETDLKNYSIVEQNLALLLGREIDKTDVNEFKLNNNELTIIKLIREISELRFTTKEIWMKLWYLIEQTLLEIGEKTGLCGHIFNYTSEEISNNKRGDIGDRTEYLLHINEQDEQLFYNGNQKEVKEALLSVKDYGNINMLVGEIGCAGKVSGRAIVISWKDDINEKLNDINIDTILVVPQTTPAYVAAISKCRGLVVDEGGITSHASVISREFRKPSIINTKYGTKVFKDGDSICIDTSIGMAYKVLKTENDQ